MLVVFPAKHAKIAGSTIKGESHAYGIRNHSKTIFPVFGEQRHFHQ